MSQTPARICIFDSTSSYLTFVTLRFLYSIISGDSYRSMSCNLMAMQCNDHCIVSLLAWILCRPTSY